MLAVLALFSLAGFALSLILIPWLIGRLDRDYFRAFALRVEMGAARPGTGASFVWALARNTFGLVLCVLGLVMLVLPGQGLLTLLLGLSLLDFPGKPLLFAWLLQRKSVRSALNWIRRKQGREEFFFS